MNSMTGYGRGEFRLGERVYCVELRSYNNRFLDVKVRLPWVGRELEPRVEAAVRGQVLRGRVDVSVWEEAGASGSRLQLDRSLAQNLAALLGQLAELMGCDLATAARLVLPLRELVLADPTVGMDAEQTWSALQGGLDRALKQLGQMRRQEGQATLQDLKQNMAEVGRLQGQIARLAEGEPELHRQRLVARVQGWSSEGITIDPQRVAQEVAILADRCDVSEELARLGSHIEQMGQILEQQQGVGRKIEFLLQEFNRELNTVASKSQSAEAAHLVVEAKSCVERMREQSQNVE